MNSVPYLFFKTSKIRIYELKRLQIAAISILSYDFYLISLK